MKRNREIARLWIWQILKTVFSVKDVILSYLSGNINCLELQYCMQFAGSYEGLKNWRASAIIESHLMEKVSLLFHSKAATGLFYCTFAVSIVWYFESVKERRRSCFYDFLEGFLDAGFVKPSDEQIYCGIFWATLNINIQVNLFQKPSFLHQLIHNMTRYWSLNSL